MIKLAILGAGFIAHNHCSAIVRMPGVELTCVVDIREKEGREFAEKYGTKFYSSFKEMIEKEEVDIIDICVPTYLHEEYVIKSAEERINVLCEKPFALSPDSGERMVAACKKNGVKLMVAQVLRFWPEYQVIKNMIDKGELGEKIEITHLSRLAPLPWWSAFYSNPQQSGGGMVDLHLHDIDFAYYLFGPVKRVYSIGFKNIKGAWNNIATSLTFKNGSQVVIEACEEMSDNYPFTMYLRSTGTNATVEFILRASKILGKDFQSTVTNYSFALFSC